MLFSLRFYCPIYLGLNNNNKSTWRARASVKTFQKVNGKIRIICLHPDGDPEYFMGSKLTEPIFGFVFVCFFGSDEGGGEGDPAHSIFVTC